MTKQTLNEHGGASAVGSLLAIFLVGAVGAVLYFVIDKFNQVFTGMSAGTTNTVLILESAFGIGFIIFLLLVVINHILNEKSEMNGSV